MRRPTPVKANVVACEPLRLASPCFHLHSGCLVHSGVLAWLDAANLISGPQGPKQLSAVALYADWPQQIVP